MHRSRPLLWLSLALCCAGCGSVATQSVFHLTLSGIKPSKARFDPLGLTTPAAARLVWPLGRFGLDLLAREATAHPQGNIVLSPASIHAALAMTLAGARGETARQMAEALDVSTFARPSLDQSWADLIAYLGHKTDALVQVSDSLWLRHGITFEPTFLAEDRNYFSADLTTLPDDPAAAAKAIDDWVAARTAGLVKNLVGPVPPDVPLVLVNTIHVKAGWRFFPKAKTYAAPFTLPSGQRVDVPTMHGSTMSIVSVTPEYTAVPLEANGLIETTLVLPSPGQTPESVVALLAKRGLQSLQDHTRDVIADVSVPRLHLDFRDDHIETILQSFGMKLASSRQADFSGMSKTPMWIAQVIHEAVLNLNEQGVEAAAGTAVVMATGMPPTEHLSVRVDRPFVIVLSDGQSQVPLFIAIVRDPR